MRPAARVNPICVLSAQKMVHDPIQIIVMIQKRFRSQRFNPTPVRSKCDQNAWHTCGPRGLSVRVCVAHQKRAGPAARRPLNRQNKRRRVGLAHRQRVGPNKRVEQIAHTQPGHQGFRQPFRLVGANAHRHIGGAQPLNRRNRPRIKLRMHVNRRPIGFKKQRIAGLDLCCWCLKPQALKTQFQHCSPTAKSGRIILPMNELRRMAQRLQSRISRRDQIAGGVGQCPVQIEDHRAHPALLFGQISACA